MCRTCVLALEKRQMSQARLGKWPMRLYSLFCDAERVSCTFLLLSDEEPSRGGAVTSPIPEYISDFSWTDKGTIIHNVYKCKKL